MGQGEHRPIRELAFKTHALAMLFRHRGFLYAVDRTDRRCADPYLATQTERFQFSCFDSIRIQPNFGSKRRACCACRSCSFRQAQPDLHQIASAKVAQFE